MCGARLAVTGRLYARYRGYTRSRTLLHCGRPGKRWPACCRGCRRLLQRPLTTILSCRPVAAGHARIQSLPFLRRQPFKSSRYGSAVAPVLASTATHIPSFAIARKSRLGCSGEESVKKLRHFIRCFWLWHCLILQKSSTGVSEVRNLRRQDPVSADEVNATVAQFAGGGRRYAWMQSGGGGSSRSAGGGQGSASSPGPAPVREGSASPRRSPETMGAEARSEAVMEGHETRRLKKAAGAGLSAVEVPASGRDSFAQGSASVSRSSGGAGSSSARGGVQSGGVMSGVAAAARVSLPSIRDVPGLREELEAGVPDGSRRAYRPPSPPQAGGMRR